VLHDLFAVSFEDIAPIVGRSPGAARHPDGVLRADRAAVKAATVNREKGAPLLAPELRGNRAVANCSEGIHERQCSVPKCGDTAEPETFNLGWWL
jgi:hypothetical protein